MGRLSEYSDEDAERIRYPETSIEERIGAFCKALCEAGSFSAEGFVRWTEELRKASIAGLQCEQDAREIRQAAAILRGEGLPTEDDWQRTAAIVAKHYTAIKAELQPEHDARRHRETVVRAFEFLAQNMDTVREYIPDSTRREIAAQLVQLPPRLGDVGGICLQCRESPLVYAVRDDEMCWVCPRCDEHDNIDYVSREFR